MKSTANFLAADLGASGGRVMLGQWDGGAFLLSELHRFPNAGVQVAGHWHWDVLRLWQDVQTGLGRYALSHREPLRGIGVDSWAVDFGLLDAAGRLLGNPYCYRDRRTEGVPQQVFGRTPWPAIFRQTGIQLLTFNTLYQLAAMALSDDPQLRAAESLLLLPDLLGYWLTGRRVAEYTNATTTQFLDWRTGEWATDLLAALDIPTALLPPIVAPGTLLGALRDDVAAEAGLSRAVPVFATASHDTASAVAAIPDLDDRSAYISSGTWSLVGLELSSVIVSDEALAANVTNEGGVAGTIRLLKNVTGLWLLQECQRQWRRAGLDHSWAELVALAQAAPPLRSMVDPDAPKFAFPTDMPAAIRAACERARQPTPESVGAIARACLESVALKYRLVLETLERLSGRRVDVIRVVGGGSHNALLCQFTADACGRPVVAGPAEATALGNVMLQAVAAGHISDVAAGRRAIAASVPRQRYEPQPGAYDRWGEALARSPMGPGRGGS